MNPLKTYMKDDLTVKVYENRRAMGFAAAEQGAQILRECLETKDEISVIFAAAPSQNELLEGLLGAENIDWSRVNAFHMDEYVGFSGEEPQSFAFFLDNAIFKKLPFKTVNYINGAAEDIQAECQRYSEALNAQEIDVVFMGVGENGHIAFNDPPVADFQDPKTVKIVELDEKCRMQQVHDGCFKSFEDVPTHGLTITVPGLMRGRHRICVVPGKNKAAAIKTMLNDEINESCPATILRKSENSHLFIDLDSASLL